MFWIVGGSVLAVQMAALTEWRWLTWLAGQMQHPPWIGFAFYDLIFPLFLFLAGVAMPYSIGRRLEGGASRRRVLRQIAVRVFLLVLLGAVYNGALALRPLTETRLCSVLGYIGLAYGFAALIYLYAGARLQAVWAAGILFGYWAALVWIDVPGYGPGVLTPEGCITGYLDRNLLPWKLNTLHYDAQGILVTVPAIATALLGALTGQFLRGARPSELRKGMILLAAGALGLALARLWGLALPISKNMWNGTFVLHCAGWSLLLLGLFYLVIDVLGFRRWSFFFVVIGMNSITIYLATRVVDFHHTTNYVFGGLVSKADEPARAVFAALAYILTWWLVLFFLYRRKIFLRV